MTEEQLRATLGMHELLLQTLFNALAVSNPQALAAIGAGLRGADLQGASAEAAAVHEKWLGFLGAAGRPHGSAPSPNG